VFFARSCCAAPGSIEPAEERKGCAPLWRGPAAVAFADSCTLSPSKGALPLLVDGSDLSLRFRGLLFANGDGE
jgi:hypothetical protein